jgi:ubiquinone/menaquinone biosynthesis C-methylase UbiE
LLIRWAEIYANTDILSPIDRTTWRVIGETCRLNSSSRVIELASGKGVFATFLARTFGCGVDCYDHNPEFVDYSKNKAEVLGLGSTLSFNNADVKRLEATPGSYDLGACLGALYIFREEGWKVLMRAVRPRGYIAVSDLICKKFPAPKEIMEAFFEEPDQPFTLDETRKWYASRGVEILREVVCSQGAWLDYYDLTKEMLLEVSRRQGQSSELQAEVEEGLREDRLIRKYGKTYLDYVTFIMQKL